MDLHNALSIVMVFHTTLLLIKELTSQQVTCGNGPMLVEFLVLPCSPPSWSSWLDKMVKRSFEDSFIVPIRWQYLAGLAKSFPEASNIWCFPSHSQDSQAQESRVGMRMAHAIITHSDPLVKFLLSFPLQSYGLLPYKPLFPKGGMLPLKTAMIPLN